MLPSTLGQQFRQDAGSHFLAAVADFARRTDATRAARFTGAAGQQFGGLAEKAAGQPVERRALARFRLDDVMKFLTQNR